MKTYTGPTLGGGTATITCPDWCDVDHAYWDDMADDCFHKGALLEVNLPKDRANHPTKVMHPMLGAELQLHSTSRLPSAAAVWMQLSEYKADGLELDLAGVDSLLGELDRYRDELAKMRSLLAAIDSERRNRH